MLPEDLRYCLAKQIGTAHAIETGYGTFWLDEEMSQAVAIALEPILLRRLAEIEKGDSHD